MTRIHHSVADPKTAKFGPPRLDHRFIIIEIFNTSRRVANRGHVANGAQFVLNPKALQAIPATLADA